MNSHELYMHRCLQLAALGAGRVAPNPMVGSVLVHEGRIIGEGYHRQYGDPHAEVNCLNSVPADLQHLIPQSVLYVSLEPCAHFGRTPPCADLIVRHRIPQVVIGTRDPFEAVNGKGIEKLLAAGIRVELGILEKECQEQNRRFFTFHTRQRPYIILKWAQTADGFIAPAQQQHAGERLHISQALTNRLVHKWRSEEAAILVGTRTALQDDPSLTNRLWTGNHPVRLVVDRQLTLPDRLQLFDRQVPTVVFNDRLEDNQGSLRHYLLPSAGALPEQVARALYQLNLTSVIVEGGARLLQAFIDAGCYDEARVIKNTALYIGRGLAAPQGMTLPLRQTVSLQTDHVAIFCKPFQRSDF